MEPEILIILIEMLPFYRNCIDFFQTFREILDSNLGNFEILNL